MVNSVEYNNNKTNDKALIQRYFNNVQDKRLIYMDLKGKGLLPTGR